ncbi:SDR family oxidoreductase [Gordonia sp. SCSIO 19800]|uniref:SDR family NAD(P)-dependent oxidoreductase n=1 Tax=Gordonia sp. SCSIO 19800 TaxID=2826926 RepID=UPI0027DEAAF6|nr:SDR family oxidoreductase [Gordonia sp. SCSIO 19800]
MTGPLAGRVALVTGGSRGVGRAVALRLARDGAAVAVSYRRETGAATEVVDEIASGGGHARAYQASIDDTGAVEAMVEAIVSDLGAVDLLVNNAGSASRGSSVATTPHAEFQSLLQVHALGPIRLIQLVLPGMRAAASTPGGRGDIVMISSSTTTSTPPNSAPYTMAKSAMEVCMKTLAQEERDHGIHAGIVAPGLVATDMGRRLVNASRGADIGDLDSSSPFGRVCRPEDVAGAVAFLVSPDAGYMTGQRLVVDGGGPKAAVF